MFIETAGTIATKALWESRAKLAPLIRKLRFWLLNGTLRVPIFGPGGTGKSTLALLLSGETIPHNPYRESLIVEDKTMKGDLTCTLFALPGQERRQYQWTKFYQELAAGKSAGIINVVAFGYHSFEQESYQEMPQFKTGQNKPQFLAAYLKDRQQREQKIIEALAPKLGDAKGKLWMITLVTKQDLWWKERAQVKHHYTEGDYHRCIASITQKLGEQNFAHEYLSASLVASNLMSVKGEMLAPTAQGYDDALQLANQFKLIETVTQFVTHAP